MEVFLMLNGQQVGPYKVQDIQGWIVAGYVQMEDAAWFAGCEAWIQVRDIPGIYEQTSSHSESKHLIPPFEAYSGDMPFIFVSYAHKDSERVFAEITRLHESGYKIWYDEGIEASSEWPEEIANAVIGCAVFLVFISPNSTASVNCRNEINLALNENKPFLAIHLDESELPPGLRLRMGDLQAILQYKLPADRYNKKLLGTLDQLLGKKKKKAGPKSLGTTSFAQTSSNITSNPKRKKRKLNTSRKVISIRPASKSKLPMFFGWCIALLIGVVGTYKFLEMKNDPGDDLISSEVNHKVGDKILVEGQPWTSPSSGIELIWCKPGTFLMGSPESEMGREEDENQHQVTLSKGFFLGKFEVTQSEFEKIMKRNPSKYVAPSSPVDSITWQEANEFCIMLTQIERKSGLLPKGWAYGLPTEAQWEYACRAGTRSPFSCGAKMHQSLARWSSDSNNKGTVAVGSYKSNPWGFYDMHGNVWEWCANWYGSYPTGLIIDPSGPVEGFNRVRRGGSWMNPEFLLRSACRFETSPSDGYSYFGFRLCLTEL